MDKFLSKIANAILHFCSRPLVFTTLILASIAWFVSGWYFEFSDKWHLAMDVPATLLGFLLFFVLLHRGNTDAKAIHAKLDELICNMDGARDDLEHVEDMTEEEIEEIRK
jgi:low affinity Fe/Cu permease